MKRYMFTVMMLISVAVAIPVMWQKILTSAKVQSEYETEEVGNNEEDVLAEAEPSLDEEEVQVEWETVLSPENAGKMDETDQSEGVVVAPVPDKETPDIETPDIETPDEEIAEEEKTFVTVDSSYWSDALFIGDSRTVGLSEYADLGGADVFANSGMSVYKAFNEKVETVQFGKMPLEEILGSKQYGKIYIMLGINELGYDYNRTVEEYGKMLEKIQELQPGAILFLEANLHVTQKQSSVDKIYNNAAINKINQAIQEMADQKTRFYVDINELFDDEQGNLDAVYTADSAHVLGKHYVDWANWLMTKGILL